MKAKHYLLLLIAVALINTQIEGITNIYIQFVICVLMVPLAATLDKEAQKKKP
ncbi:hypothetical protein [Bacteroides sp.]|uniref:hypothetical protein n=1 Tax=Bacteroides sp. TaxID=29523 RepID=UPI00258C6227|nr:hypothetical protein [Bacteroides sp.]